MQRSNHVRRHSAVQHLVSLDTLYLVIKPHEVCLRPFRYFENTLAQLYGSRQKHLPQGEVLVQDGGMRGFKYSAWIGDARIYFADHIKQGVWVQLGPKFIKEHMHDLVSAVARFLAKMDLAGVLDPAWLDRPRVVVNRIDVVCDVLGLAVSDFTIAEWAEGWVGLSHRFSVIGTTRQLETVYFGTRESAVYLRIYDKVVEAVKTGDIAYWRQAWGGYTGPVTRIEWEVKPGEAGFAEFEDFAAWSPEVVKRLALYLIEWGRLCVPHPVRASGRWQTHPVWLELQKAVAAYCVGVTRPLARVRSKEVELTPGFLKYVAGALASGMARVSEQGDFTLEDLLSFLAQNGYTPEDIRRRAGEKFQAVKRLRSKRSEEI